MTPKEILGHISGGRVLDVATGSGGFIHFLLDGLKNYTEIIGIDTNPRGAGIFAEAFIGKPKIHFELGDALCLSYPAASFDTVCISNSLHHFKDPQTVLGETTRLLRPGGHLILAEMYRDRQTETQMTHVYLHHWWGAVDRISGIVHNETFLRDEIVAMFTGLGLNDQTFHDLSDTDENPKKPENLAELTPVIDRYIQRAEGNPDLQARGEELRQRIQEIGFHGAASLIVIGTKDIRFGNMPITGEDRLREPEHG
jgi:SAM-dependent methyltransferase